jgi:hypothetical protein
MNFEELQLINIDSYKLRANHCRTLYKKGGVCIYVQKNMLQHVKIRVQLSIYDQAQIHKELRVVKLKNDCLISFKLQEENQLLHLCEWNFILGSKLVQLLIKI